MLKLKNIKKDNDIISCDVFPEGDNQKGILKYDLLNKSIIELKMPNDYNYLAPYIVYATRYFDKTDLEKIPKEKTFMWY